MYKIHTLVFILVMSWININASNHLEILGIEFDEKGILIPLGKTSTISLGPKNIDFSTPMAQFTYRF